jgi:predicted acyltransferase
MQQDTAVVTSTPLVLSETVPTEKPKTASPAGERVMCVDVLRGFDMFWLVGGTGLALGILGLIGGRTEAILKPQLDHAEWIGFTFYDFIFPLFVFMVGMSVVFSVGKLVERQGLWAAYKRIFRRTLLMFALGIVYNGGLSEPISDVRWMGVLQRLALCYFFAAILYCHLRTRGIAAVCVGLLAGYWALMSFAPLPGHDKVSWEMGENWHSYVDILLLPGKKHEGLWDGNGLLGTFSAVCNALIGVLAAQYLLLKTVPEQRKSLCLMGGGALLILLGGLWAFQTPVIKLIWTPSYVLVSGGLSLVFLGLFHQIIDVWKIRWWTAPFLWIGANALTIYLARNFVDFNKFSLRLVGGSIAEAVGPDGAYFLKVSVSLALSLLVVRFLYKKGIFLRV